MAPHDRARQRWTYPLWFLRDLHALIGIARSFWPLVIMVIANDRKVMRGKKIAPAVYGYLMLPLAEAKLRFALYRQAFKDMLRKRDSNRTRLDARTARAARCARLPIMRRRMLLRPP